MKIDVVEHGLQGRTDLGAANHNLGMRELRMPERWLCGGVFPINSHYTVLNLRRTLPFREMVRE